MNSITLPLPDLTLGEHVEIDVTVGGRAMHHEYRVEAVPWSSGTSDEARIDRLRRFIAGQSDGWTLVQIGLPQQGVIPVTLRRRPAPPAGSQRETYAPPREA